jgi:hypothetical protein
MTDGNDDPAIHLLGIVMRHFFDHTHQLDYAQKQALLDTVRRELKKTPMNLNEMSHRMTLVCLNGGAANQYIPKGMDNLITVQFITLGQTIRKDFTAELTKVLGESGGEVLGYVLENIQVKNIHHYLDIVFKLKRDFQFEPYCLIHFSNDELIDYLVDFLHAGKVDGVKRQVDVYDEKGAQPWKTLTQADELQSVDKRIKTPIVLDRPFFADIQLKIVKLDQPQVVKTSFGQLKSVQPHFNKRKIGGGDPIRSKNKLFIKIEDIHAFKVSSAPSKVLQGISHRGSYVAAGKFITHDIGLSAIRMDDIDFFRLRQDKRTFDVRPAEINGIEINLDTQQVLFTRGITEDEYHIGRFAKLKLTRGKDNASIHRIVPFNRGESNFELIQTYFGSRYTEYEKARAILTERGEFGLLSSRKVAAGDFTAALVLSSMHQLGSLPFDTQCIGFDVKDINNSEQAARLFKQWFVDLQRVFQQIIDVSKTPNFTEHNFSRLTRSIQAFLKLTMVTELTPDVYTRLIGELEALIQYMDDFFKLNVYSVLKENLETDTVPELEEADTPSIPLDDSEVHNLRLDNQTKAFITENYAFFEKRSMVQTALLRIEKMLFYHQYIKPYAEDSSYEPDLIVFVPASSQLLNFRQAAYPALALVNVMAKEALIYENEDEELSFIRFMREFTRKTHQKSLELNKSFHHQFKHTLAELTFIADEKRHQLTEELAFLEKPENREAAYQKLLEKITTLFHQHLAAKQQSIEDLQKELTSLQAKHEQFRSELATLLDRSIASEEVDGILKSMPKQLDEMKVRLLADHRRKLADTSPVLNAYVRLHRAAIVYFNKILKYANLFLKALWVHRSRKMFQAVKAEAIGKLTWDRERIEARIQALKKDSRQTNPAEQTQKEIHLLMQKIRDTLLELNQIPIRGLFQNPPKPTLQLRPYLSYYQQETDRLGDLVRQIQPVYQQLSQHQNELFRKQDKLVAGKLVGAQKELTAKIYRMMLDNPGSQEEIDRLEPPSEKVPDEIKDELGTLRTQLLQAVQSFQETARISDLENIADYEDLIAQSDRRDQINDVTKELVNYSQGITAVKAELQGEIDDLEYLKSQEGNLEQVAMSKALPSTRVLLKTQYIPLVDKEKKLLVRANQFLSEIVSGEKALQQALVTTFFKKRYGIPQFLNGSFCLDISRGTKDHTEKNVFAAFMLIAERFQKACGDVLPDGGKKEFKKLEINGIEGLRNRVSQIWHGHVDDRFIYLPAALSLNDALELCEYKDLIARNNPKTGRSKHSLILIFVHKLSWDEIRRRPELKKRYNQAILSNIFINVDGVVIFNNRESIFDACIRETFGQCWDKTASQIVQNFLYH